MNSQNKNPENKERFRGVNRHRIPFGFVLVPSSIQTILSAPELRRIMPVSQ